MYGIKIPKSLIYAQIGENKYDVKIDELYNIYVGANIRKEDKVYICFYDAETSGYLNILENSNYVEIQKKELEIVYSVIMLDEKSKLRIKELYNEVDLPEINLNIKCECKDKIEEKNLCKYPIEIDRKIEKTLEQRIYEYSSELRKKIEEKNNIEEINNLECCITLDSDLKIKSFLSNDKDSMFRKSDMFSKYWLENYATRIYIGSQFCPLKMVDLSLLDELIYVSKNSKYKLTINTSFITEDDICKLENLAEKVQSINKDSKVKIDVVVNDYGAIKILEDYNIDVNCGVLLNRRQKDPRFKYRWGYEKYNNIFKTNALNSQIEVIHNLFEKFARFEYECNHIGNVYSDKTSSIHFPFYQTNTSKFCPLNAAIYQKNSEKQYEVKECSQICDQYNYIFSDEIPMIGIGNSIFGIDTDISKISNDIRQNNIDRIIYDFI